MTETTIAAPWSAEVERFVVARGLRADLLRALELVARAFGPTAEHPVNLLYSPEDGELRAIIDIVAHSDFETAVACREALADMWTRDLPLRAQDHMAFTYTYTTGRSRMDAHPFLSLAEF